MDRWADISWMFLQFEVLWLIEKVRTCHILRTSLLNFHKKYFLSKFFLPFGRTVEFTVGEFDGKLDVDGVRHLLGLCRDYGSERVHSFLLLHLCRDWSHTSTDTGVHSVQLWLCEYLHVSDELFCFCQQK